MFKSDRLLLHFELSTRCNAYCPGCPRYVNSSRVINPLLEQTNITLDQYMRWLPEQFIQQRVHRAMFCGNYGEPIANPEVVDIIKYTVRNLRDDAYIIVNTNGGLGSVKQWSQIGNALKNHERHTVFFSIDGLEDTNHIYRREVLWHRVDENVRAYTATGATGMWDYLVFDHNRHQKSQAEAQCKQWGLRDIRYKEPMGFHWNGKYHTKGVYDRQGHLEYTIAVHPTSEQVSPTVNTGAPREVNRIHAERSFTCRSLQSWGTELMVHVDGTVYPCCYMGDLVNRYVIDPAREELNTMFDKTLLSLNTNTFEDICQYFNDTLWKTFTPQVCIRECGQ